MFAVSVVPIPEWKGDVFAEWSRGAHNLRLTVHYIGKYADQRAAPFATGAYKDSTGAAVTVSNGKTIDAQVLTDLAYLEIADDAFHLKERAPGVSVEEIVAKTGGKLVVPAEVPEMRFA